MGLESTLVTKQYFSFNKSVDVVTFAGTCSRLANFANVDLGETADGIHVLLQHAVHEAHVCHSSCVIVLSYVVCSRFH